MRARTRAVKAQVLALYAGGEPRCALCGYSDPRALSLDHVNGDGRAELFAGRRLTGTAFYWRLAGAPRRPDLQVLCMNCQLIKARAERPPSRWPRQARSRARARAAVLALYAGLPPACADCGTRDHRVLTVDHVGGGAQRRGSRGFHTGTTLYARLRRLPRQPGLQVLCANCQFVKREARGEMRRGRT